MIILLTTSIFALSTTSFLDMPSIVVVNTNADGTFQTSGMEAQADWYDGANMSTAEVDLTYTEEFIEGISEDFLRQRMWFSYKDNTGAAAGFDTLLTFAKGGLDTVNKVVLDWNLVKYSGSAMVTESTVNSLNIVSEYVLNGFEIVNGTAEDLELILAVTGDHWQWIPKEGMAIASIRYTNTTNKIGVVDLTTQNYTYQGATLKESIAQFNITINATIGNIATAEINYIPVTLIFEVRHNITATTYKYGVDIDWSTHKAFHTADSQLKTGDDFSLYTADRLNLGDGVWQAGNFTSNLANDTALFLVNGFEYGRQYFTTNYQIKGNATLLSTKRIYLQNATSTEGIYIGPYMSRTYVVFDGFKYNESSGLEFDPYVIVPCSETQESIGIPWFGLCPTLISLLVVASVVVRIRRETTEFSIP